MRMSDHWGDILDAAQDLLLLKAGRRVSDWQIIDQLASEYEPRFRNAFLRALKLAEDRVSLPRVANLLAQGKIVEAINAIPWPDIFYDFLQYDLSTTILEVYFQSANVTSFNVNEARGVKLGTIRNARSRTKKAAKKLAALRNEAGLAELSMAEFARVVGRPSDAVRILRGKPLSRKAAAELNATSRLVNVTPSGRPVPRLFRGGGGVTEPNLPLDQLEREAARQVGGRTAAALVNEEMTFDITSLRGLQQLERQGAALVTDIAESTRQGLRSALVAAREQGLSAQQSAKLIRPMIGLLQSEKPGGPRHMTAVVNRVASLRNKGLSENAILREASSYAGRLRQFRARMIAITEPRHAAVHGQREAWEQTVDQGLYARTELQRRWVMVGAEHVDNDPCPELDGLVVGFDEPFVHPSTGEQYMDPSETHPHCTCQLELVVGGR